MAPTPPTLSAEASDLIAAAQRRQTDITDFQIPRLRSCKGPLSLQQNLAAELREDVDALEQQVEALDLCVDDQRGDRNRKALRHVVDQLREALSSIRREYRAALLSSKRTIHSQMNSQREELLRSSAVTGNRPVEEKVTDDALMNANDNVTEALRRTIALMQGELERSVLTTQMLDSSTASLRSTSTINDTLTNLMGTSKQLITALEKADWIDRMLILSAFVFFVLVVLLILKQRILDRGIRIAFWWTRFLPDFSGDASLLVNVEEKGAGGGVSGALSVVTSLATDTSTIASFSVLEPSTSAMVAITATATAAVTLSADSTSPTGLDGEGVPSTTLEKTFSAVMLVSSPLHPLSTHTKWTLAHVDEL